MYLHDTLAKLEHVWFLVTTVTQQWDNVCSSPTQLMLPEKLLELPVLFKAEESPCFTP